MLKVYAANWCPHCKKTVKFLEENNIKFDYIELEEQPQETVKLIIDANGGDDWVVPTLEFNGCWRPGKVYRENELRKDLKDMGVI
ncbi:MAG: glutaredoxin family protein [Desulfobacterium sp.]|nr:glutaredoxin family protein [Desulfobacterium sp.]MBU3947795.1 glutaredoxin family protein [Pseudomonadota bacterium]MBU4036114.1 glutaredoxin family protein [Pseudomonadota bacterium]